MSQSIPWAPFLRERHENAVAFAKAGNAKLNENGRSVNDGEETIKMRGNMLITRD
jgi:hypothetical protein